MQSVRGVFQMLQEDPVNNHMSKYTMSVKPSDFSTSKNKRYDKYECFVTCKNMKKSIYTLKVPSSSFIH